MKSTLILFLTCSLLYCFEVDAMIANISMPKETLTPAQIAGLSDVFEKPPVTIEVNKTVTPIMVTPIEFSLKAIFEDVALINDKWMKLGDIIHGYKIEKIERDKVFLANGKNKKILHLFKAER